MKAKQLVITLITLTFLSLATNILAEDDVANSMTIHPQIVLKSIQAKVLNEKDHDEIYLNLTEFSSESETLYIRIPHKPIYWPSRQLDKIKDIKIWDKEIPNNKSYEVVIELVEHDVPPWNVDDLIGVIRLRIKNDNGHMTYQWSIFDQEMPMDATFPGPNNTFNFDIHDKNGHYLLEFSLTEQ